MSEYKGVEINLLCPDCHEDNWGEKNSDLSRECFGCKNLENIPNYYTERYLVNFWRAVTTKRELSYLAGPYSHPDKTITQNRFEALNRAAAALMQQNKIVYSPISHTHPIAVAGILPTDWNFWKKIDSAYLRCSKEVIILTLDGWKESTGVNAEIKLAESMRIPISYMEPV